uniref:BED-type domain-containing protein n=1 Tax=Sphenodon punctatus TaxID=8508 RepID=A0A8D0LB58_SPHPU
MSDCEPHCSLTPSVSSAGSSSTIPSTSRRAGIERFFFKTGKASISSTTTPTQKTHLSVGPTPSTNAGVPTCDTAHSWVWQHFDRSTADRLIVTCRQCKASLRLSYEGSSTGILSMICHMQKNHASITQDQHATATLLQVKTLSSPSTPQLQRSSSNPFESSAAPSSDCTIMNVGLRCQKYPASHPRARILAREATRFFAVTMLPFSFVATKAFRRYVSFLCPRWEVPSQEYFATKALPELCHIIRCSIQNALHHCEGDVVHLAVSLWSSLSLHEYLSVTAHWLSRDSNGNLGRKQAILSLRAFKKGYKAENVQHHLNTIIEDWLTPLKLSVGFVVTDNATKVRNAIQQSGFTRVPCFVHCINLVVQAFLHGDTQLEFLLSRCRKLTARFSRSAMSRRVLKNISVQLSLPKQHLLREVKIPRWSSTFLMLQRLQHIYVEGPPAMKEDAAEHITPSQWSLLKDLIQLLKPLCEATDIVSKDTATLSQYMILVQLIEYRISELAEEFESAGRGNSVQLARKLVTVLQENKYLSDMRSTQHARVASFLDARFKATAYSFPGDDDNIERTVREAVLALIVEKECQLLAKREAHLVAQSKRDPEQAMSSTSETWEEVMDLWDMIPIYGVAPTPRARNKEERGKAVN